MKSSAENEKTDLAALSSECITLILQLRMSKNVDDPIRLRTKVRDVLDRLDRRARDVGYELEDVQNAKFALIAFLDEAITTSTFNGKEDWLANPLQLELFGRNDAGEEFFRRLSSLRQRPQVYAQTLEIYYLCLVLGYKGKYFYQDTESLRGLVDDTKSDLMRGKERHVGQTLSPHGMPQENIARAVYKEVPLWMIGAGAAALGILFFLIMSWTVSSVANDIADLIR
jgi:type VI secretion system protein ImpK